MFYGSVIRSGLLLSINTVCAILLFALLIALCLLSSLLSIPFSSLFSSLLSFPHSSLFSSLLAVFLTHLFSSLHLCVSNHPGCLQVVRPSAILNIIQAAESMRFKASAEDNMPQPGKCERCGYISSQKVCKACLLLDGLNRGLPNLGIGRSRPSPVAASLTEGKLGPSSSGSVREGPAAEGSVGSLAGARRTHRETVKLEYEAG